MSLNYWCMDESNCRLLKLMRSARERRPRSPVVVGTTKRSWVIQGCYRAELRPSQMIFDRVQTPAAESAWTRQQTSFIVCHVIKLLLELTLIKRHPIRAAAGDVCRHNRGRRQVAQSASWMFCTSASELSHSLAWPSNFFTFALSTLHSHMQWNAHNVEPVYFSF